MDTALVYANFANELSFDKLPPELVDLTKRLVLDELGVMLVGSSQESVRTLFAAACDWGGKPEASILLHPHRLPAHNAALVNGTMGRAYDYDALHEASVVHATAGAVPQCLVMSERRGNVSGREFITALVTGMEFMIRLGLSFKESFLHTGRVTSVHATTLGGALACAKLLKLNPSKIVSTFGLAFTQIGGNLQNVKEGTMLAQVQQGFAGQAGVLSATMAAAGLRGPERVFQGEFGYFMSYHDGQYDADALTRDLGERYELQDISIKYYPCCFCSHYANEAMLDLVREHKISAEAIDAIDVKVTRGIYNLVCTPINAKRDSRTTQEALFSLPHTVAAAAVHGEVKLRHMSEEGINDPSVRELARKVSVLMDERLEQERGHELGFSIVSVRLKNGDQFERRVDTVKGHPAKPMTFDDCFEKLEECVAFADLEIEDSKLSGLVERIHELDRVADITKVLIEPFSDVRRRHAAGPAARASVS